MYTQFMGANAEVLLVAKDGSVIMQIRDNKPGITNPGMITTFGGHVNKGETPKQAALREITEETNLQIQQSDLEFFKKIKKTKEIHGEDWDVYIFRSFNIEYEDLEVFEGQGYKIIKDLDDASNHNLSLVAVEVLKQHFHTKH